jgi:hypothetical protein
MVTRDAALLTTTGTSIQLALGLNFVPAVSQNLPPGDGPDPLPGEELLDNVVPMTRQYQWLAAQAEARALQFDPGLKDPLSGYPIAAFVSALNALLQQLPDTGINYTAAPYYPNHVLRNGAWVPGGGHIFKLLADGVPVVIEARVQSLDFQAEILISVEVVS